MKSQTTFDIDFHTQKADLWSNKKSYKCLVSVIVVFAI